MELTVLGCSGSYGGPHGGGVQRLPRPRRATPRSGSTAATARSPTSSSTSRSEDLTAVVITHEHPDHCVDIYGLHVLLRYGLERERPARCSRPKGSNEHLGTLVGNDWGDTFDVERRSTTATGATSAASTSASRAPTTRRPRSRSRRPRDEQAARLHLRHRPGLERRRVRARRRPRALGGDVPRTTTSPSPIHLSAHEAGLGAREAGARRLMLTHLWPRLDPHVVGRGRIRGVRRVGDARRPAPRHRDLTGRRSDHMGIRTRRARARRAAPGRVHPRLHRVRRRARCSSSSAAPACCAPRRSRSACRRGCAGPGKGWVTAEYSMLPGSTAERSRPRGGQGQAVGPHPGDPAADRAVAARGHRPRARWARSRSRSTATCSRPTAAPARRRSAAATSRCTTRARGSSRPKRLVAPTRSPTLCGAISVGVVDALGHPRPRLLRGRPRRGRHERRHDRRRALRRGAGHGRGRAVHRGPSSTTCSASPSTASPRSSTLQRELLADPPAPRRP